MHDAMNHGQPWGSPLPETAVLEGKGGQDRGVPYRGQAPLGQTPRLRLRGLDRPQPGIGRANAEMLAVPRWPSTRALSPWRFGEWGVC